MLPMPYNACDDKEAGYDFNTANCPPDLWSVLLQ